MRFAPVVLILLLAVPRQVGAITRVNGSFSLEETYASGPGGSSNLVEGGVNIDITPQTKKNLRSRFSFPLRFSISDTENSVRTTPAGNFAVDLGGEFYNLNLQYGRTATVSSTADMIDSTTSRAALSLMPPNLPKLFSSFSKTESTTGGITTETDAVSLFSDYRYRWVNLRGGYNVTERTSGNTAPLNSSSILFGIGGNYEIAPRTVLSADYDFNRSTSELSGGGETVTTTNAFRVNAESRPLEWFGVGGNFTKNITDFDSGTTDQQFTELTATLYPAYNLRLSASVGNRVFNDVQQKRDVTFTTVGAAFNDRFLEKVQLGMNASRSHETDPSQGDNIRDNLGLNVIMDIIPRITVRANLNVNRNENEEFVSARRFDESGALADRDALAADPARNLQPGFIFFDTVNNDLYTLLTPFDPATSAPAVWSLPTRLITGQFSVSKNIQVNMTPTDKTGFVLSYASSASSGNLDIAKIGNQSFNGSFTYLPNRRTSYSLSGTATLPEVGSAAYCGAATMSYRFFRRHQMNLSYARQSSTGRSTDTLSGTLGFALRKRTGLDIIFSSSQLFEEEQRYFIKVRFIKSF
jgi:hypothetical protein